MNEKKSSIIFLTLLLSIATWCGCSEDLPIKKTQIIQVASELLDANSSICLTKGRMALFTRFKNHAELQYDTLFYLKEYRGTSQDTVLQHYSDSAMAFQKWRRAYIEKRQSFDCFDTIETFNYVYDDKRVTKPGNIDNEVTTKTKRLEKGSVFTTYLASEWITFLNVLSDSDTIKTKIASERELVDFFLYDLMGDLTPEIFVIRHVTIPSVIMGELSVIEMEVYQIRK
ncbi:MAG TPA: hypothetical protein VI489_05355 [Candidatus Brocadiaceae bacterium]